MARKKETKEMDEVQAEGMATQPEVVQEEVPEVKEGEETPEIQAEEVPEIQVEEKEIPAYVDQVLKVYPNHEYLYVSKCGGAFTSDTQPSYIGDAILYKNPYYNK